MELPGLSITAIALWSMLVKLSIQGIECHANIAGHKANPKQKLPGPGQLRGFNH